MTEIRHIVFDIGKVLVHYDPDLPFSRLIPDTEERQLVLRERLHVGLEHRAGSRPHLGRGRRPNCSPTPSGSRGEHPQLSPPLARDGAACL